MEAVDTAPQPESRIRHITGVGIHEFTLPESESTGPGAGSGSVHGGLQFPITGSPRARRSSHAGLDVPIGRARAPTLAGEAVIGAPSPTPIALGPTVEENCARPLTRCFVTLSEPEQEPPWSASTQSRSGSPSLQTPPQSPARERRPPVSRSRTTSLPPKSTVVGSNSSQPARSPGSPTFTFSSTASPTSRRSQLNGNAAASSSPKLRPAPLRRSTMGLSGTRAASDTGTLRNRQPPPPMPFFFSPIHSPSTHPRWAYLEQRDFAPWLTVPEGAGTRVCVNVWYEEPGKPDKWRRMPHVGGVVDLAELVPLAPEQPLPPNTLQWTLSTYPKAVFYLPPPGAPRPDKDTMKGIMERSLRETRMKKGPTLGALHQLVNIQSVIADTKSSIQELQRRIDALISGDGDRAIERRDVSERALHVHLVRERIREVDSQIEETKARTTLHHGRLAARRALLQAAMEREDINRAKGMELSEKIVQVESERSAILPKIHRLRATHAQALDAIFTIETIHPQSLLYSILGVPLPIPLGPKDPAPPLSLPPPLAPEDCPRVDERTTAAALGYVAIVVHLISGLGGAAAGLAYPVTYAGSRSHVRDVVSVMQGPRSFPLYAKGVERYRYEYAVFLLNKDIEMLMLEADIRMLDLRHTLPNLKNLLLTLSSPDPPPPGPVSGPGWASGAASSASSRRPPARWSYHLPLRSVSGMSGVSGLSGVSSVGVGSTFSPIPSTPSVSLTSASIHSIRPTSEDASMPSASTAVSPLPWSRMRVNVTAPECPPITGGQEGGGHKDEDEEDDGGSTDRECGAESEGTETADEKR